MDPTTVHARWIEATLLNKKQIRHATYWFKQMEKCFFSSSTAIVWPFSPQGVDDSYSGASYSYGCSWSMYFNMCKFAKSTSGNVKKFKMNDPEAVSSIFFSYFSYSKSKFIHFSSAKAFLLKWCIIWTESLLAVFSSQRKKNTLLIVENVAESFPQNVCDFCYAVFVVC